jgi:hypothetical protein
MSVDPNDMSQTAIASCTWHRAANGSYDVDTLEIGSRRQQAGDYRVGNPILCRQNDDAAKLGVSLITRQLTSRSYSGDD